MGRVRKLKMTLRAMRGGQDFAPNYRAKDIDQARGGLLSFRVVRNASNEVWPC